MFNLMRMLVKREIVREITASPDGLHAATAMHPYAQQLADEIRATGSAADVAANCLRNYMPKPFAPPRPKHPPQTIKPSEE